MHVRRLLVALGLIAVTATFVAPAVTAESLRDSLRDGTLRQVGTYDYLVQPDFAGLAPLSAATKGATLGLGTFAGLDGEYVMVGGIGYRVSTSGIPVKVSGRELTPFVQAIRFSPTRSVPITPGTQCADLIPVIDAAIRSDSGIVAVRLRGTFTALSMRSVPEQQAPWPSLGAVISEQAVFPLDGQRAVLVGFRQAPDYLGVGQPGLHLHGLTADRSAGGHVLSCTVGTDAQLSVQRVRSVDIRSS